MNLNKVIKIMVIRIISLPRYILYLIYGFDKWHIAPSIGNKYVKDIVNYLNSRKTKSKIVEIGCGLGNIITKLNFSTKLGLDNSQKVIKAAKLLTILKLKNVTYRYYDFIRDDLNEKYDVIILVNWVHNIKPNLLKQTIFKYFTYNLNLNGEIIIDCVKDENYKYNHDINHLTSSLECETKLIGVYPKKREVWSIKYSKK